MSAENYTNPFDSEDHEFLVLKNAQGQYCLWPEFSAVPSGWQTMHGPAPRENCNEYVERHWHAINPFHSGGKSEVQP